MPWLRCKPDGAMSIVVRRGILRPGWITMDGVPPAVRRGREGWYVVYAPPPAPSGRVRYFDRRDRAVFDHAGETIRLRFRSAGASSDGRPRASLGIDVVGRIRVTQNGREVVLGRVTPTGVRLEHVSPELFPIIRELALVLALHSEALSREPLMYASLGGGPVGLTSGP